MYLRFVSPVPADRGRGGYGLFDATRVAHDPATPEAHRIAITEELGWFRRHLPVPAARHFEVRSRGRWYDEGICWFRDDAREMLAHAFVLSALLRDLGVPIHRLHTRRPGQILYRDAWQIVAKPTAETPVMWE